MQKREEVFLFPEVRLPGLRLLIARYGACTHTSRVNTPGGVYAMGGSDDRRCPSACSISLPEFPSLVARCTHVHAKAVPRSCGHIQNTDKVLFVVLGK